MSDLSVTQVQAHLRALAGQGHDIISRPGGLTLNGKHYPMVHGHGISVTNDDYAHGTTIVPVSESGNVGLVTSLHLGLINPTYADRAYQDIRQSTTLMHPHITDYHGDGVSDVRHIYVPHPDEDDYDVWSNPTLSTHEALQKMSRVGGRFTTSKPNPDDIESILEKEMPMSNINEHNPAEAAWNTIAANMIYGTSKELPQRPSNLDLASMGRFIHVHDVHKKDSYLYHPETERLVKL